MSHQSVSGSIETSAHIYLETVAAHFGCVTPDASMNNLPLPPTLDVPGLAALLHASPETIAANASRAPHRLPPAIRTGGRRLIWLSEDVLQWLAAHRSGPAPQAPPAAPERPPRRRPGRPTKAESMVRKRTVIATEDWRMKPPRPRTSEHACENQEEART